MFGCQNGADVCKTAQVDGNIRIFHNALVGVDARPSRHAQIPDDARGSEGE